MHIKRIHQRQHPTMPTGLIYLLVISAALVDLASGQQQQQSAAASGAGAGPGGHAASHQQPILLQNQMQILQHPNQQDQQQFMGKIQDPAGQRPSRQAVEMLSSVHTTQTIIDLSHPLHDKTLHWPQNSGFSYSVQVDGDRLNQRNETYHLKMDNFTTAVHTGTHIDAPIHFSKTGWTIEQIPLDRLVNVPLTVVDVSDKVRQNRSYSFVKDDFFDAKTKEPLVKSKSVVLVYTGISEDYDKGDQKYFGNPTGDLKKVDQMRIPGFSADAAYYLAELGVYGVGLDSPSADSSDRHGPNDSMDLVAHIALNGRNIYILENISSRLKELLHRPDSWRLIIAPLPIVSGSGSPVRLLAVAGHDDANCHCMMPNSGPSIGPMGQQQHHLVGAAILAALSMSFALWARRLYN